MCVYEREGRDREIKSVRVCVFVCMHVIVYFNLLIANLFLHLLITLIDVR